MLYLLNVCYKNQTSKLLLCNGEQRVLEKIEKFCYEQNNSYIYWEDYLENNQDPIQEYPIFKKGYFSTNDFTFQILDSELIN